MEMRTRWDEWRRECSDQIPGARFPQLGFGHMHAVVESWPSAGGVGPADGDSESSRRGGWGGNCEVRM